MPLRRTNLDDTKKFEDGDAWLVLRIGGLTKGERDQLRDLTGAFKVDASAMGGIAPAQVEVEQRTAQANRLLFEILCESWSLGEVSGQAYSELDEESGEWVDHCISDVLEERRKRAEKNVRSSQKRSARATSARS